MSDMSDMKVLYRDRSWWLGKDKTNYWLHHTCATERDVMVRRGVACNYQEFKPTSVPCSFCKSVCPEPLQGLYNMLVYL